MLTNYIGFNSFLGKQASSLMGKLNYQLILNLRFKGREQIFFKINIFMLQKMKGVLKGHFRIVFETIFPGGLQVITGL